MTGCSMPSIQITNLDPTNGGEVTLGTGGAVTATGKVDQAAQVSGWIQLSMGGPQIWPAGPLPQTVAAGGTWTLSFSGVAAGVYNLTVMAYNAMIGTASSTIQFTAKGRFEKGKP